MSLRSRHTVRLGMMRITSGKWTLDENMDKFLHVLEEASRKGVELAVTPESYLDGYAVAAPDSSREKLLADAAQDLENSPYLSRVAEEAGRRGMWIVFGFTENKDGKLYNSAGLWNAQGELVGVYHKVHLQVQDLQFDQSDGIPVFDSPWGPLGMMICADRRWPETSRVLRLQGAQLILNPTAGMNHELNTCLMRARSWENNCYIAFNHPLTSLLTDPEGNIVVKVDENEDLVVADIDLRTADLACNNDTGNVTVRRPDLYGAVTDTSIRT